MMNKGRPSGQDNTSREGVVAVRCGGCDGTGEVWESCGCYQCEYDSAHAGYVPCLNCDGTGAWPPSARTSAETPQADCPSSQSKDVT